MLTNMLRYDESFMSDYGCEARGTSVLCNTDQGHASRHLHKANQVISDHVILHNTIFVHACFLTVVTCINSPMALHPEIECKATSIPAIQTDQFMADMSASLQE